MLRSHPLLLGSLLVVPLSGALGCDDAAYGEDPLDSNQDPTSCDDWDEADFPEEPADFGVEDGTALMWGYVTSSTPDRLASFLDAYPDLELLVMPFVPGSEDDLSNLEAGRMLHEAGVATCLPAKGMIASGGVDFFLAGSDRAVGEGGLVGVHSWAAGGGLEGGDLPEDHEDHEMYLDYYDDIGITEDFYWFTLDAAPSDDIHWMTEGEMETYGVTTSGGG